MKFTLRLISFNDVTQTKILCSSIQEYYSNPRRSNIFYARRSNFFSFATEYAHLQMSWHNNYVLACSDFNFLLVANLNNTQRPTHSWNFRILIEKWSAECTCGRKKYAINSAMGNFLSCLECSGSKILGDLRFPLIVQMCAFIQNTLYK